jgi:tetratricopeptide (TPR) repeat protein
MNKGLGSCIPFAVGRTPWSAAGPLAGLLALVAAASFAQQPPDPAKSRDINLVRLGSADQLKAPVQVPRGYAVIIGVSNYKNLTAQQNLAYPEKDAENLYSTLISKEGGNFEFENIKKLVGKQATIENIRNALEVWLPSHAQEGDRAVVFFVGHGVTDKNGKGYIAPWDLDPQQLEKTAYPMERLGEVISKQVKAKWKVLLMDACHSGKVTIDSTPDKVNESLRGLPQGFLTMTSSRASEQSFEDKALAGGNGVFTYFLTKGWAGEADDDPRDGVVTADELVSYVKREVRNYARERGFQQNPLEFGDFPDNLVLGYNSQRRGQLAASLPQLSNGKLVIEVNLDDVQVDIDEHPYGTASRATPLPVPGLASGKHVVRGSRMGYEPVSVEVNVAPGAVQTVSLRLLRQRVIKPNAKLLYDQGQSIWLKSSAADSDLKKAADFFSRAVKEDSNYSQAALGLCRVKQAQGEVGEALKSCQRATEIDPDYVEARTMTGVLFMESGDYPEAVRQVQRAATQDPGSSYAASLLAEALFLADRPKEAEDAANKAVTLDPTSAQAYLMRGEARRAQMRFDEAIEDYNRTLHADEFGSNAARVAAFWLIGTGMQKHRSGYQFLYRSQKAAAYYGLCAAEVGRENYVRAVRDCKDSLAAERDDPDTFVLLAECYARLFTRDNRREYLVEARNNIESTLRVNPNIDKAADLKRKLKEIGDLMAVVK